MKLRISLLSFCLGFSSLLYADFQIGSIEEAVQSAKEQKVPPYVNQVLKSFFAKIPDFIEAHHIDSAKEHDALSKAAAGIVILAFKKAGLFSSKTAMEVAKGNAAGYTSYVEGLLARLSVKGTVDHMLKMATTTLKRIEEIPDITAASVENALKSVDFKELQIKSQLLAKEIAQKEKSLGASSEEIGRIVYRIIELQVLNECLVQDELQIFEKLYTAFQ